MEAAESGREWKAGRDGRASREVREDELLFCVDRWSCNKNNYKLFFLTHLHSDHTKGLSESWQKGPIYCSSITYDLILLKFPAFDRSLIHSLPVGIPSLISIPTHDHLLEVTAIDADHCPGSVMFIFRGPFGCIFHTGDFRWESGSPKLDIMKRGIANAISGSRVDLLCLDNTFCNSRISFPPRHVAAQQVLHIILSHKDHDVLLGIDMLGKEELLISISNALQTKIWVWPERLRTMRVLGISDFFTTDTTITRIYAVPRYSISLDTLRLLNEIKPTIAIVPSGLWSLCNTSTSNTCVDGDLHDYCVSEKSKMSTNHFSRMDGSMLQKPFVKKTIFFVSYSLHSCFLELRDFIEFVNPISIKGNTHLSYVDINPQNLYHARVQSICSQRDVEVNNKHGTFHCNGNQVSGNIETMSSTLHSIVQMEKGKASSHLRIVDGDSNRKQDGDYGRNLRARISLRKIACLRSKHAWAMLRKRKCGGSSIND